MTITDSVAASNKQDGIIAVTTAGGAPIGVMVKNTKSANNAIGIRSIGPNVTVRVDNSAVIGNGTGLSFSGGGALLSFGNNNVAANGTNGAFSGRRWRCNDRDPSQTIKLPTYSPAATCRSTGVHHAKVLSPARHGERD